MFAVVDANNFFASCERVFRPDLANRPVAVLSSNDGCVVARSSEVRAIGIPMGTPYFKVKRQLKSAGVTVFSSNFGLYSDMSQRMQAIINASTPEVEIYSIDEAFVYLKYNSFNKMAIWAEELRQRIWQWLGLPVAIGIAPTKTLAKIASHQAKTTDDGIFLWQNQSAGAVLDQIPLVDIWGIGRHLAPKLEKIGLKTAADLSKMDLDYAGQLMGKRGVQTVLELRGKSCLPLESTTRTPQTIIVSRSFGSRVRQSYELEMALASFVSRAAAKLRRHNLRAGALALHLRGIRGDTPYYLRVYQPISHPTSDTAWLLRVALDLLGASFDRDVAYKKAGVLLFDLSSADSYQSDLFQPETEQTIRRHHLMQALDYINQRYGDNTLKLAAEGTQKGAWQPRSELRSPDYTRSWQELPKVS